MLNSIKKLAWTAASLCVAFSSHAFSLLGPFDTYQVPALDYKAPESYYNVGGTLDIGGPQNLGEWYRWNTPRIYYAYDGSFVDYFGSNGVRSVEQAIAVFNALPAASVMSTNLNAFPTDSRGQNYTAYALGILDLKSVAMSEILSQMGLWSPTRFVWTPYAEALPSGASCPSYDVTVIMRNFDPFTWKPSAYVNNKLYSFVLYDPACATQDVMDALEVTADPTAIGGSAVADEETSVLNNPGVYFNGLSRDDAGGLCYLLSKHQVAVEALTTAAVLGTGTGTSLPSAIGATTVSSPWNLAVAISLTNATILGNGSPWSIISFSSTNSTNSLVITNVTGTTTVSNGGPFNLGGVEKISFINVPYDSTIGINYTAFTDTYPLTMYNGTNAVASVHSVTRTVSAPDIVFAAGNLGTYTIGKENIYPVLVSRSTPGYTSAVKGVRSFVNGPGTINPAATIVFSDVGPWQVIPSGTTTLGSGGLVTFWGYFDATTNAPLVFPSGTSVQDLEGRLFP